MALFRRKQETLNEQLLREAGLDDVSQALRDPPPVSEPPDPGPFPVGNANLGGQSSRRPRRGGETMVTLRAAALPGDRIEFTTLPDGDIIVDEAKGDGDLAPCAEAVERHVDPPYRAIAVRQGGDLWAVQASRIQSRSSSSPRATRSCSAVNDGTEEVQVDDEPSEAQVPELEQLGEREGRNYCVEAERIDGDFWEVRVLPL